MMSANLLEAIQKSARKGTLLASCEPEVKELMHQIDVLLATKQNENTSKVQGLKTQLQQREREMSSLRVTVQEKNAQIEKMKEDNKRLEQQLRVQSSDHETHLLRMKSELSRLGKSYDKLKSRRGLSEEKTMELNALKEELKDLQTQRDTLQVQIAQLSKQLAQSRTHENGLQERNKALEEELKVCRAELSHCELKISEFDKKSSESLTMVESKLKSSQESIKSRERKIQSLRSERDELKKKCKTLSEDCNKLQEAIVALSNDNQSYQVGVADLKLQLTKGQSNLQNCMAEKEQLQHQLTASHELIRNKEKLIKSLDSHYKDKIDSEVSLLSMQLKELQDKLEGSRKQEVILREENSKLKDKGKKKQNTSTCSSGSTTLQSPVATAEITSYRAKLIERDQLVSALEERVHHLEEQLSDATSIQPSSSIISGSISRDDSAMIPVTGATGGASSPPLILSESPKASSAPTLLVEDPAIGASQSSNTTMTSNNSSCSKFSIGSETSVNSDKLHRVSEHFQMGMRKLEATPMATPTPVDQKSSILDAFRSSLDTVLSEHFNKINQSLRNVLDH